MFGPAPVTSATFPSSDTSNGIPPVLSRAARGAAPDRDLGRPQHQTTNAVLVIRVPPGSGHTIYDTFDDEKRVI